MADLMLKFYRLGGRTYVQSLGTVSIKETIHFYPCDAANVDIASTAVRDTISGTGSPRLLKDDNGLRTLVLVADRFGRNDSALQFGIQAGDVKQSGYALALPAAATFLCFVKPVAKSHKQTLLEVTLARESSRVPFVDFQNNTYTANDSTYATASASGGWDCVALTSDAHDGVSVYVNGEFIYGMGQDAVQGIYFGGHREGGDDKLWYGCFDDILVFNAPLTPPEIRRIMLMPPDQLADLREL